MSITLQNLIPSPSMEGTGWTGTYSTAHALYGSRSLQMAGTTSTPEVVAPTTATIPLIPSHVYYTRVYGWQDTKTGGGATMGFYWPIAEPNFTEGIALGDAKKWNLYSARNTRTSFTAGNYQYRLDFNNNSTAGTMYFDGAMLIDLTAAFGSGNEPTKEWCDERIPYFEGSLEIYAVEVLKITSVSLTPNPVSTNGALQVVVGVGTENEYAIPTWYYSGDVFAGELV